MLHSMGIGLFRFNGALCRNENIASTGGAFLFLVLLLLGGFLLSKDDIPPWWIWYCSSPVPGHQSLHVLCLCHLQKRLMCTSDHLHATSILQDHFAMAHHGQEAV